MHRDCPRSFALACVFAVAGCGNASDSHSAAKHEPRRAHPATGSPAALSVRLRVQPGSAYIGDDSPPPRPLVFAAWLDGTMIWDDSALVTERNAYRTTHEDSKQIRSLVDRARARFETLLERVMSRCVALNRFGSTSSLQEIALQDGADCFELTWGDVTDPGDYATLAPVWRDVRLMVDAAIPSHGDVIAFEPGC
jgi:hypothetical protein